MCAEEFGILSPYAKFNICWASRFYHLCKSSDTFISAYKSIKPGNVFLMCFLGNRADKWLGQHQPLLEYSCQASITQGFRGLLPKPAIWALFTSFCFVFQMLLLLFIFAEALSAGEVQVALWFQVFKVTIYFLFLLPLMESA